MSLEHISNFIKTDAARYVFVAAIASLFTFQTHAIYRDIRSRNNKEKLNRELKELYKDDEAVKRLSLMLQDIHFDESGPRSSGGLLSAFERGADMVTSAVSAAAGGAPQAGFDEGLIREQLSRNYAFFGEAGMSKIRRATVVVVGCGGVGSWAAMMLARTGVAKLRLIDFDYVTLSSLNRHASATRAEVGVPKVQSLKRMIEDVAPWVEVEVCVELWNVENEKKHGWLEGADWIIDAIDNISTKVDLLSYAHSRSLKVIASMGAGAKTDPSHIQSADISQTISDPLARSVRRRLRMHPVHPVLSGIPVVYSTEVPNNSDGERLGLLPLPQEEFEKGNVDELAPFADFRVRILPVLGMLPAILGLHIATYLTCELGGRKIEEPLAVKGRKKLWEKLTKDLTARETKWAGLTEQIRIGLTDWEVGYIFEELHRSKGSLPPFESLSRPTLIRWDFGEKLSVKNCVVMSPQDAVKHEAAYREGRRPEDVWGGEAAKAVRKRRKEAEEWTDAIF